jgi:hypothetical protein
MLVTFVRTVGSADRIYVHRSDGGEASWTFPSYGDGLPHDLVHLVVEAAFGLGKGLWGLVDAGADMARINAEANRKGGANKYRALGADQRDILFSEALAAAVSGRFESEEQRAASVLAACHSLGIEPVPPVTSARLAEILVALEVLRQRWRSLVPKGALRLHFNPCQSAPIPFDVTL